MYYPGENIVVSVHLRAEEEIKRVESLVLHVKGVESFKFVSRLKNQRSLKSKRSIVDQTYQVCRFVPSEIEPNDYTFIFKYKIPMQDTTINNQ